MILFSLQTTSCRVGRSEAIQDGAAAPDCFVAPLLAMTI
jgi:hypothetical protein